MNSRFLPAMVFVVCMLIGFGVGLEADGQSKSKAPWTTPDWELPWGMTWPAAPEDTEGEATPADDALVSDTSPSDVVSGDGVGGADDAVGPEPVTSGADPGIFPGLVNPPPKPAVADAPAAGADAAKPAGAEGETPDANTLTAQLAQLQVLEEQLRSMSTANQAARAAVQAALSGVAPEPEEPEVQASPEQIASSLVLLADMVKKMKPAKAADLLQQWNDKLAIDILRRLGSRRATPILSKMPVVVSGRLTSRIAVGVGALPPATAEGADAPPQGEVQ